MKIYIANPDAWFDTNTIAIPITVIEHGFAIFLGTKNGKLDEESCTLDEFTIISERYEGR